MRYYGTCFLLLVSAVLIGFCESVAVSSHYIVKKSTAAIMKKHRKANNCKRIDCPSKEEPQCIKLKNKKGYNTKEINIVVLNKCEIDYIKCHEGLEATLVPMKNCNNKLPNESRDSVKKRLKRSSKIARKKSNKYPLSERSRRHRTPFNKSPNKIDYSALYFGPKRRDISEEDTVDEENSVDEYESSKNTDMEEEFVNVNVENNMSDVKEVISFKIDSDDNSIDTLDRHIPNEDQYNNDDRENEIDTDDDMDIDDLRETDIEKEPELVNTAGFTDEGPRIEAVNKQYLPPDFDPVLSASIEIVNRNAETETDNAKTDDENTSTEEVAEVFEREDSKSQDIVNQSGVNSDDDNISQYKRDCPNYCPARAVMVCARCRDGVFRTFLSVCHLRIFNCQHPEEKLELVARRPCVLSAPFLSEMKTKGSQTDPNDEDVVLKYIRCREKGDKNDPNCKFANV